jgi:hypothetical protein
MLRKQYLMRLLLVWTAWCLCTLLISAHAQETMDANHSMMIKITINGKELKASLEDSPAARDFAALLPLSLTLEDYASTEKVADLPKRLNTDSAPAGTSAKAGDITYYAPWGNLAIFYKDFRYASGLVKLGQIEGDWSVLSGPGKLQVELSIEL